jgi:hypothetical protein
MFNPPAALVAARVLEGRAPSAARRPLLDDQWADPLAAAPPVSQPQPRRRRGSLGAVALFASARRAR